MKSTLIAVDTAKLVFEVAESEGGKVTKCLRLSREKFTEYVVTRQTAEFILEACGGSHY